MTDTRFIVRGPGGKIAYSSPSAGLNTDGTRRVAGTGGAVPPRGSSPGGRLVREAVRLLSRRATTRELELATEEATRILGAAGMNKVLEVEVHRRNSLEDPFYLIKTVGELLGQRAKDLGQRVLGQKRLDFSRN